MKGDPRSRRSKSIGANRPSTKKVNRRPAVGEPNISTMEYMRRVAQKKTMDGAFINNIQHPSVNKPKKKPVRYSQNLSTPKARKPTKNNSVMLITKKPKKKPK